MLLFSPPIGGWTKTEMSMRLAAEDADAGAVFCPTEAAPRQALRQSLHVSSTFVVQPFRVRLAFGGLHAYDDHAKHRGLALLSYPVSLHLTTSLPSL